MVDHLHLDHFGGVLYDLDVSSHGRALLLQRVQVNVQLYVLFTICNYPVLDPPLRNGVAVVAEMVAKERGLFFLVEVLEGVSRESG